ncbi:MAG: flagellar biosynthetic protein FliO [Gemmatales bacterium]|nr:flagellar biosynthetic protein FliO [Gemmatales bacterium]MCS7158856.1 flagellar biosynthetic protein FliO [Gemmatales bacterium]MDW8174055.1 flagellar biosynthetic protein FliO [Gemmatales bacterium]MDW8223532.1 flagellar biosynthetic protein FliO [Gemmatales bacterium]
MGAGQTTSPRHSTWMGHALLLALAGSAAVVGGYWLPGQLSSPISVTAPDAPAMPDPRTSVAATREASSPATGILTAYPPAVNPLKDQRSPEVGPAGLDNFELYDPLWRLASATLLVLALALVFLWMMRRYLANGGRKHHQAPAMQVSGELSLGGRCRLMVVQVGHERVLLAMDARGISAMLALPPRFSEVLREHLGENGLSSRRRHSAVLAAMVGEGVDADGN